MIDARRSHVHDGCPTSYSVSYHSSLSVIHKYGLMEVLGILFEINELFELTFDGNHMLLGRTALSGRSKLVRSQIPREQPKRIMALGHRNGVSNREQLRCRHNVQSDTILCWRIVRTIVSSNCRRITRNKCGNCDGSATLKKHGMYIW